ncbi:type I-PGING CRISPR-associated protein Cas7/Csp1 [Salinibacter sp. 10B]|uniref:type I-PGING CRISPR-associated protein Cas7/Csp1 n=1 Tax=Salinibacter sp. 10B TaxID=1923971 RepID=UPI000CF47BD7|nr:type I-PGING CRISPR-associated protein Cas7/Csp1 [Salinibacter sp. 10B]PQJ26848.1 type I-PGING CRISPR-associated protein Cas7/Csp1 [Salinibacter sp. 10B]
MENVKGISVTLLSPMSNHTANGGEKLLGNASSIKRRPDGRVYISGQMQRHALFSAIERLNLEHDNRGDTYVSNGDGTTNQIQKDLRADMGGFMHPSQGSYSGRRTAPVSATFAVAKEESDVGRDLLIRIKQNTNEESEQKQALATNEFSQDDDMQMSFHLDVSALSVSKAFTYEEERHVETNYVKHVDEAERTRRAELFLEATRFLNDYANQARNATTGEPQEALIVLDSRLSRKASRFFDMSEAERENLFAELDARDAKYFYGDDTTTDGKSVFEAYDAALDAIDSLYDPTEGAEPVPFNEFAQKAEA